MLIRTSLIFIFHLVLSLNIHAEVNSNTNVVDKIITLKQFLNNTDTSFDNITHFIKENPYLPQMNLLLKKAGEFIKETDSQQKILQWFTAHPPITGKGYNRYISSAIALNSPNIIKIVKTGWIKGNFNNEEQEQFLMRYKQYLDTQDHIKKIDHLLWKQNTQAVKPLLHLVDNKHQIIFKTRIAFINKNSKAIEMFNNLPTEYKNDLGLSYNYLLSYKKEGPNNSAFKSMERIPKVSQHTQEWAALRILYARELLKPMQFNPTLAYKIIQNHTAVDPKDLVEAEWLCGWIALRFLDKPKLAIQHFSIVYNNSTIARSISKASYWLGRCHQALKQDQQAKHSFEKAANFSWTFYGQLSLLEMKYKNIPTFSMLNFIKTNEEIPERYSNELIEITKLLLNNKDTPDMIRIYCEYAIKYSQNKQKILDLFKIIKTSDSVYYSVMASKSIQNKGIFLSEGYPRPYNLKKIPIEIPLAYAIIRQESSFNSIAYDSTHDDSGLMQLIPDKCKMVLCI